MRRQWDRDNHLQCFEVRKAEDEAMSTVLSFLPEKGVSEGLELQASSSDPSATLFFTHQALVPLKVTRGVRLPRDRAG